MNIRDFRREVEFWENTVKNLYNNDKGFRSFIETGSRSTAQSIRFSGGSVKVYSGTTKVVLVSDKSDYVLKIPFLVANSLEELNHIRETNKPWTSSTPTPIPYMKYNSFRHNHCGLEVEYFNRAKEERLENFFAECLKISFDLSHKKMNKEFGKRKNLKKECYLMEKLDIDFDLASEILEQEISKLGSEGTDIRRVLLLEDSYFSDESSEGTGAGELCMRNKWGEKARDVFEFMNKNAIGDIHFDNFGFTRYAKELKICDYSGYFGE